MDHYLFVNNQEAIHSVLGMIYPTQINDGINYLYVLLKDYRKNKLFTSWSVNGNTGS